MAKRKQKQAGIVGTAKDVLGKLPDVTAAPAAIGSTVSRVRTKAPTRDEIEEMIRRIVREELAASKRKRKGKG